MKKIIISVIIVCLGVGVYFLLNILSNNFQNEYEALEKKHAALLTEDKKIKEQLENQMVELSKTARQDFDEVSGDLKYLDKVLTKTFSWESLKDYKVVRKELRDCVGQNNKFVTDFMLLDDATAETIETFKLKMGYKSIDITPVNKTRGKYFAIVEYYTYYKKDTAKSNFQTKTMFLNLQIKNGKLAKLSYTLPADYNHSDDEKYLK